MPNRMLKESICTSETIAKLSLFEETFFYRLIVNCDDFGRFDARPAILKGRLYPLADVTNTAIEKALTKLSTVGILDVYEVDGRAYLQLCTWQSHQQTRAKNSKFPAPEDGSCKQMKSSDIICNQMQADVPVNENVNEKRETRSDIVLGAENSGSEPVASLCLNDGSLFDIYDKDVKAWEKLYPAVDVRQELRNMAGWCDANPRKRKTRQGIKRFCVAWLAREQDKPHPKLETSSLPKSYDIEEYEANSVFDLPEGL